MIRRRSAGDIIEAQCTRCRAVLNHTIVAMVEDRVVRVQCNTCGGQHNYRAPQEEKKAASPSARKTAATAGTGRARRAAPPAGPSEWETRMAGIDQESALPYAMDTRLRAGNLVSHPVFGLGIVTAFVPPNKAEILFRDGTKLLRCAP